MIQGWGRPLTPQEIEQEMRKRGFPRDSVLCYSLGMTDTSTTQPTEPVAIFTMAEVMTMLTQAAAAAANAAENAGSLEDAQQILSARADAIAELQAQMSKR